MANVHRSLKFEVQILGEITPHKDSVEAQLKGQPNKTVDCYMSS